ncbi:hypothetical protein BKA04_000631 [Cryobacterium mesophilum]|uniref:Uncharacterized protein n=1 Tax=Terrimesophilobacter mesophilus TaxID=433647 RepID=A0A4R8V933_9MICO|nr:hypothetical protein [Terrimesophilobacter mesophilus]MBB5632408.1 hypothetical protein [Terrimesophilobacter mesophilus]TFB79243.1 hypothetical protein E3N84_03750 [Terrimesophilobacter mesophilus]
MPLQSLDKGSIPLEPAAPPTGGLRVAPAITSERIQYGGRTFTCTPEMARIFLKHAREVIETGDEQLVPLLHNGGIELLHISRATPYTLLDRPEP